MNIPVKSLGHALAIGLISLTCIAALAQLVCGQSNKPTKPNIVFVLADGADNNVVTGQFTYR